MLRGRCAQKTHLEKRAADGLSKLQFSTRPKSSGLGLASVAPTARAAQSIGLLLWFVMLFVSGTSAPLDLLPGWMVDLGKALPLYHLVISLVDPWIGRGVNWMQLGIVAVVGLVTTLLSLRLFRWE